MKNLIRFDWAMKKLLRDKANYVVLEGFLSELLKFDITILQMGESEGNQMQNDDKFNRVDILAHTSNDEVVLIELQSDSELDYFHRMLYGVSKSISEHIKLGENYGKIKKVYSVNIVYFHLGQGTDYVYHGKTEFRGLHTNDVLGLNKNQLEKYKVDAVHEIYPEYYILKINDFNDIAKDGLDEWIYFFKNTEVKDNFKAKGLDMVKQKLMVDQMSEPERIAYDRYWENKRYEASMFETATFEGEQKGIEQGIELGIEQEKINSEKKLQERNIEIAKNLIKIGMKLEDISNSTGLSIEEINKLK